MWGTEDWWNLTSTKLYYMSVFRYDARMFIYFTILALCVDTLMNTIVFIDLYLSLSDPFKSREGRRKYYKAVILMVLIVVTLAQIYFWSDDFELKYTALNKVLVGY